MFISILTVSRSNSVILVSAGTARSYDANRPRWQRNHQTRQIRRIGIEKTRLTRPIS